MHIEQNIFYVLKNDDILDIIFFLKKSGQLYTKLIRVKSG